MPQYKMTLSRRTYRQLKKIPAHINEKLETWIRLINDKGLFFAQQSPSYRDEALQGKRKNQRSIRLSKSCRAIYTINDRDTIKYIHIEEVNKHAY